MRAVTQQKSPWNMATLEVETHYLHTIFKTQLMVFLKNQLHSQRSQEQLLCFTEKVKLCTFKQKI